MNYEHKMTIDQEWLLLSVCFKYPFLVLVLNQLILEIQTQYTYFAYLLTEIERKR